MNTLELIKESYVKYLIYGPRSNEKIKPLHRAIEQIYKKQYPHHYIYRIGKRQGELRVNGKFFAKNVDLAIVSDTGNVEKIVSVKFPMSTVKSNLINYLENALGECHNLGDYRCEYFFVLRQRTPEFDVDYKVKDSTEADSELIKKIYKIETSEYIDKVNIMIVQFSPHLETMFKQFPSLNNLLTLLETSLDRIFYDEIIPRYGYVDINLIRILGKHKDMPLWLIKKKIPAKRFKEVKPIYNFIEKKLLAVINAHQIL